MYKNTSYETYVRFSYRQPLHAHILTIFRRCCQLTLVIVVQCGRPHFCLKPCVALFLQFQRDSSIFCFMFDSLQLVDTPDTIQGVYKLKPGFVIIQIGKVSQLFGTAAFFDVHVQIFEEHFIVGYTHICGKKKLLGKIFFQISFFGQ